MIAIGTTAARAHELPSIPVIDVGHLGPLAVLKAERARAQALLASARRRYTRPVLRIGDELSERWLARSRNPFADSIRSIGVEMAQPGAVMLNLSYEWACTSIAAPDRGTGGARLMRTLDWPFDGLGAHVVVARESGPAGPFFNVTWPGSVGVLTAMAPGRFAVALNQAPMTRRGFGLPGDWLCGRLDWWRSSALPPTHLLRRVVETAPDYATAVAALRDTDLSLPCFYIVAGLEPTQSCVIERLADRGIVHDGAVGCANDWLSPDLTGRPRGRDNSARRAAIESAARDPQDGFGWVTPPILNHRTRLAVTADARAGTLSVVGIESSLAATQVLQLAA
ncbi:MAG: hypothetical protein FJX57_24490 [Alphaproteobacteria bacterium]|nr:hypothetical protein [Alphaproteobacteria bacterium]